MGARIVFITGIDEAIGKTVLTGLLLACAQDHGLNALAMKPFCAGGREEIEFLDELQQGALEPALLNPFYFEESVAPLVSARLHRRRVSIEAAARAIKTAANLCDLLLVEGAGGLLVPLARNGFALDLILKVGAEVIIASQNRPGTINHTLLTARVLQNAGVNTFQTVLLDTQGKNACHRSNLDLLESLLSPQKFFAMPSLGGNLRSPGVIRAHAREHRIVLSNLLKLRGKKTNGSPAR